MAGVEIGDQSIVASNTVVTKSFEPYSVIAGNPGKVIKKLLERHPLRKQIHDNYEGEDV